MVEIDDSDICRRNKSLPKHDVGVNNCVKWTGGMFLVLAARWIHDLSRHELHTALGVVE